MGMAAGFADLTRRVIVMMAVVMMIMAVGGVGMSTSKRACGPAARNRGKSSRSVLPHYFLGSVAVAGLVLGCAWTVYTNVFGAGIYPSASPGGWRLVGRTTETLFDVRRDPPALLTPGTRVRLVPA